MASSRSSGKPYLVMVIEPENKFRFRYQSESAKSSHGGILGKGRNTSVKESKKGSKKTYPTVKLENYHGKKPVVIRASLYIKDKTEKHVLDLKGKYVQHDGMHYQDVDADNTAAFKNLTIINKKKEEIQRILIERKIDRLGRNNIGAAARRSLEKNSAIEIKDWQAEFLNSAVLCFEAFAKDNLTVPICEKLFSERIDNQKSSLKIHRMSLYAGSCQGGDEVILLCDKVKKDAIKVVFSDTGDADQNAWKAEAIFHHPDVHHQVAITFKTPPYRKDAETTVYVYLSQDGERSESVEFLYKSDSGPFRKRKRVVKDEAEVPWFGDNKFQMNDVSQGSSSNGASSDNLMEEAISMPNEHSIDVSDNSSGSQYSKISDENQVNSASNIFDGALDESSSSEILNAFDYLTPELYNMFPEGMIIEDFNYENPFPEFDGNVNDTLIVENVCYNQCSSELVADSVMNQCYPDLFDNFKYESSETSDGTDDDHSETHNINNDLLKDTEINEDTSGSPKLVIDSPVISAQSHQSLSYNLHQMSLTSKDDLLKHVEPNPKAGEEKYCKNKCNPEKIINFSKDRIFGQMLDVEGQKDGSPLAFIPIINSSKEKAASIKKPESNLKEKCSRLLYLRDYVGNTILHLAVLSNKNVSTLLKIIKVCRSDIINIQNYDKQTAVLLATEKNNAQHVRLLLKNGADPNIKNDEGNNCFHIASKNKFVHCLKQLCQHPNLSGVKAFNYEGLSPLHIAVIKNSVECFNSLLIEADINAPDKKSGRTPLHYAVERSLLVANLLNQTNIDVNFQDFSGNSPLHVACTIGNLQIVKQLLDAGADPLLKNFKQNPEISELENFEDETADNLTQEIMSSKAKESFENETVTVDGQTPLDIASNVEVLEILKRAIQSEETELSDSDQSDSYTDASETSESVMENKLSNILDGRLETADWEKILMYIGIDERYLDAILKCSPSPTKAVLSYLKRDNEDNYIVMFENILQLAGLNDVLSDVKDK